MTKIRAALPLLLLLAVSCRKEIDKRSSFTALPKNSEQALYVGKHYGGGVIFYIDSTGQHGCIADTSDLGLFMWWNGTNIITGAKKTTIGAGKPNTRKIVSVQGTSGTYAALVCSNSARASRSDWVLPSKDELNEMYKQKKLIGRFSKNNYWSSSEINGNLAWFQSFADGIQASNGKHYVYSVRAVRSF